MITVSCVRTSMWRASLMCATALALLTVMPAHAAQRPAAPAASATQDAAGEAAAMADFQKRLDAYLELRENLSKKVKPLSQTADSAELTTRQEALAAAMKSARAQARPGDLVPKLVATRIAQIVAADYTQRAATAKKAALEEVPNAPTPAINRTYPAEAALPTVPPLLLSRLPKLPDNLQYRFYGRHVVILDGDLQIITDYIANALPPH